MQKFDTRWEPTRDQHVPHEKCHSRVKNRGHSITIATVPPRLGVAVAPFANSRKQVLLPSREANPATVAQPSAAAPTAHPSAAAVPETAEMMDRVPETVEMTDPEERRAKMRELLTKYDLVVEEEEDPDWPEDAEDGMGFSLGQFFDKITIKDEKKDDAEEEDDSGYQSDKEVVWEDDNYIKLIRDVRTQDWDASVFTDFGPMIVLVHNRYKRPQDNEMARAELTKAIEMFWEHNLPSPRMHVRSPDLVDALKVSGFREILFTNAGKIIHRDKVVRSAEAWSRMMAFFY